MAIVRKTIRPGDRPKLSAELAARQDAMTEDEIQAAAEADEDNPPLTEEEMAAARPANPMRRARQSTGLSQAMFAERYRIGLARVRDIEQGRSPADSALLAYLLVIENDPASVDRALSAAPRPTPTRRSAASGEVVRSRATGHQTKRSRAKA